MSSFTLEKYVGKVAVVTGVSSGIGKAITKNLVKSGLKVAALARRLDRLEELANELSSEKGKVYPFQCDVSNEKEILDTFQQITSQLGPIHVLVNNAGTAPKHDIIEGDSEKWKTILDVNVLAVAICSREAIRSMKENNITGHVININSTLGHKVGDHPGISLYTTSKHALTALTETLRLEINRGKLPIKITSISPGYVRTEFIQTNHNISDAIAKQMPGLEAKDLADATFYVLSTPDSVNINELILNAQGNLM